MRIIASTTGSSGNITAVESYHGIYLIDCGICAREVASWLSAHDINQADIIFCLVTHYHGDHVNGLKALQDVPIIFGESYNYLGLEVTPYYAPHDVDCYAYRVVDVDGSSLAWVTDCGVAPQLDYHVDILGLEFNHDPIRLHEGQSYPQALKERIGASGFGHLSNLKAIKAIPQDMKGIVYPIHLSQMNNDRLTVARAIAEAYRGSAIFDFGFLDF